MSFATVSIFGPKTGDVFGRVIDYKSVTVQYFTYSGSKPSKDEIINALRNVLLSEWCIADEMWMKCGEYWFTLEKIKLPSNWFGIIHLDVDICVYYVDATGRVVQRCEEVYRDEYGYDRTGLGDFIQRNSEYSIVFTEWNRNVWNWPFTIPFDKIKNLKLWDKVVDTINENSILWIGLVIKLSEVPALWWKPWWTDKPVIIWEAWWSRDEIVITFPLVCLEPEAQVTALGQFVIPMFQGGLVTKPIDKPLVIYPKIPYVIEIGQEIPSSKFTLYNPDKRPVRLWIYWTDPYLWVDPYTGKPMWIGKEKYDIREFRDVREETIEFEVGIGGSLRVYFEGKSIEELEKLPEQVFEIPVYVVAEFLDTGDKIDLLDKVFVVKITKESLYVNREKSSQYQVDPENQKVVIRNITVVGNSGTRKVKILGVRVLDNTTKSSAELTFDKPIELSPGQECEITVDIEYVGLKPGDEVIVTVVPIVQSDEGRNVTYVIHTNRTTVKEKEKPIEVKIVSVKIEPSSQTIKVTESAEFTVTVTTDRKPNVAIEKTMDVYVDNEKVSTEVITLSPGTTEHKYDLTLSGLKVNTHSVYVVVNGVKSNTVTVYVESEPGVPEVEEVLVSREVDVYWEKNTLLDVVIKFSDILEKDLDYTIVIEPVCGTRKHSVSGTLRRGRSEYKVTVIIPWNILKSWIKACNYVFTKYSTIVKVFIAGQVFTGEVKFNYVKPITEVNVNIDKTVVKPYEPISLTIEIRK